MPDKTARLLYGEHPLSLRFPESVSLLQMKPLRAVEGPERAVYDALKNPIESPPLSQVVRGRKNACVVISDFTRPVPNKVILPPLLKTLEDGGIPRDRITILIATGMHRPNLGEELVYLVGRDIAENYRIVNHYCRDPENYRKIDEIDGAPIEINRHYLDADLKILTGLIEPHFYAGYSGGRKAILPGISSYETMKFMHSFKMIDHPNVTNCVIDGNPFHEYGIRVTERVGADFILNVVITQARGIAGIFAGHYDRAHLAGCDLVYRHSVIDLEDRVDMVVTSGGGFPLDATFYQISKALICARNILKRGGTIVVACECREGLGNPEFCEIMRSGCGYDGFCREYADPKDFVIDQWCSQSIFQAVDHAGPIYVYSPAMSEDDLKAMGMIPIRDLQETVDRLLPQHDQVMVVPEGPYVVGRVKD